MGKPKAAAEYLFNAKKKLSKGNLQAAIKNCDSAIALNPNCTEAYVCRAIAKKQLGLKINSLSDCDTAISQEEDYSKAWYIKATIKMEEGNFTESVNAFERALHRNPEDVQINFGLGMAQYFLNNFSQSKTTFSKIIQLQPEHAEAHLYHGLSNYKLNRLNETISDLDRAIQLNPSLFLAIYQRGIIRYKLSLAGAYEDLTCAFKLKPTGFMAEGYFLRAELEYQLGQYNYAMQSYNKAIELEPDVYANADTFFRRAQVNEALGQPEFALADYIQAIKLKPNFAQAYYRCGMLHKLLNRHPQAIIDFSQGIELGEKTPDIFYARGSCKLILNGFKEALKDFDISLELNRSLVNNLATIYFDRGMCKKQLGDLKGAVVEFTKYLESNTYFPEALYERGIIQQALGKHQEALADFSAYITMCNHSQRNIISDTFYYQAVSQLEVGNYNDAVENSNKAIELNVFLSDSYYLRAKAKEQRGTVIDAIIDYLDSIRFSGSTDPEKETRALKALGISKSEFESLREKNLKDIQAEEQRQKNELEKEQKKLELEFKERTYHVQSIPSYCEIKESYRRENIRRGYTHHNLSEYDDLIKRAQRKIATHDSSIAAIQSNINQMITETNNTIFLMKKVFWGKQPALDIYNILLERARKNYNEKNYQIALEDYSKAARIYRLELQDLKFYAFTHYNAGNNEKAISILDQGIQTDPKDSWMLLSRGHCKHRLGRNQEAVTDLNASVDANSEDPYTYYIRGHALLSLSLFEQAISDFQLAIVKKKAPYPDAQNSLEEAKTKWEAYKIEQRRKQEEQVRLRKEEEERNRIEQDKLEFQRLLKIFRIDCAKVKTGEKPFEELSIQFGELERRSSILKTAEFYKARGEFYETQFRQAQHLIQKKGFIEKAREDYQRALAINLTLSDVAERINNLEQELKKIQQPSSPTSAFFIQQPNNSANTTPVAEDPNLRAEIEARKARLRQNAGK